MSAIGVSWRLALAVIITTLHIPALSSVKTTVLTGAEGQRLEIRCDYPHNYTHQAKYFCHANDHKFSSPLIQSEIHDQWVRGERFALYDNTSGDFFTVTVNKLRTSDGGMYWCGVRPDHISVVKLNVLRESESVMPHMNLQDIHKLSFPLYLTAVACVSAILFVCAFISGLLLAMKNTRSRSRGDREMSLDYESMVARVRNDRCSDRGCKEHSPFPPAGSVSPPITPKQRESAVSLSLSDYGYVDVSQYLYQYEHLDLSSLENHIYHSLEENSNPKPQRVHPSKVTSYSE